MALTGKHTLGDIDLGSTDAESDRRLSEYFINTPYVESALSLSKTHYLGRKGSGKSALFTQLQRLFAEAGCAATTVLDLTPDEYAWSALKQYEEQGLLPEQAHTNAWKFTIAIEAAGAAASLSDEIISPGPAREAREQLRAFLQQNYGSNRPTLYSTASRLVKGIRSFNLEAFGFGVGFEKERQEQPITPQVIESILKAVTRVTRYHGITVALDKLDDSWDGSEKSHHILIGLLKAAKEINDGYSEANPERGLTILVFLRSDIYEGLRFDDKDKHRGVEEQISWNPELLKAMVNERLPTGVGVDELFEEGDMRGGISPFNYIVKRTFLRPREVIQFLQLCLDQAGKDAAEITKDQVRGAEERYSVWKVDDLKQEYSRVARHFGAMLEGLRQGLHRYDSIEEFEQYLNERAPEIVKEIGSRSAMVMLFNSSAIGVRLGNAGSPRFKCEDSDLVLPTSGAVYVHQSLYKGLSVREKRARDGNGDDSA